MRPAYLRWFAASLAFASSAAFAQLCPEFFEDINVPALPGGWQTTVDGAGVAWSTVASQADTPANAAFAPMPAAVGDSYLQSPSGSVNGSNAIISFRHAFDTEAGNDGGVLEISIGGGPFSDILTAGGSFLEGGYNSTVSTSYGSPIAGRQAWTGNSGGYVTTTVQLPASAIGQEVKLRWRIAADNSLSRPGWWVDSIVCGKPVPGSSPWRRHEHPYPIAIESQATTVMNGVLYSFGGWTTSGVTAASYKFDGQQWIQIGDMPVARYWAGAVNDGSHIFILGGQESSGAGVISATMYRYTPQTNVYETMAPFSIPARGFGLAILDGHIYKFGGMTLSSTVTDVTEAYDIGSNTWSTRAPYPSPIAHLAGFARNGHVYGVGGFDDTTIGSAKTYRYDPVQNLWDDAPIPDLPIGRVAPATIDTPQGVLLVGGYVGGGALPRDVTGSAIAWNATTNTWRAFPALPATRGLSGGGWLQGRPLLVGGRRPQNLASTDMFECDRLFADGFDPAN
ncbi:hypothetical protein [Dokdonella sp.]|uniref:Kelch repeat-containing protein n=1 Tax=Dokdonella sp. TaxID=2291710 RepID=UPI0025BB8149|nr:hypothetical protein [Dokdonella sp.]MBX3689498.1 hypothetical protein [Dokdonella sp.]